MRWPWQRSEADALETRDADYSDAIVGQILRNATGGEPASMYALAALEAAAGIVGRSFAVASVQSASGLVTEALPPSLLALIGRSLIRRGQLVCSIETTGGRLALLPAASWDVQGGPDPRSWQYRLELGGPSGSVTRRNPGEGVIDLRYSCDPAQPWRGLGPLQVARLDGRLGSELAAALGDEAAGPRGSLLPVPGEGGDGELDELRADIAGLHGKAALLETTSGGWGEGKGAAPQQDWTPKRLGPNPSAALVQLRRDVETSVVAACGVPLELLTPAAGTGGRESYRRFLFSTVAALGRIVADELTRKLETPVSLDWGELRAADISGRARAYQSLVGANMDASKAERLAGLLE